MRSDFSGEAVRPMVLEVLVGDRAVVVCGDGMEELSAPWVLPLVLVRADLFTSEEDLCLDVLGVPL